ncbi:uncharacterized protein [Battus philenor]|uniref:uncharacterized protein n=1 Tax=Battus philenor TaxID=42288 RepID=UPI0035D127FB
MKLISNILAFCMMVNCGRSQFEYGEYFKQQSPDVEYHGISQSNYLNNADALPIFGNEYNYDTAVCECTCDICYTEPKTCCIQFCSKCAQAGGQPGYVYVPYPYIVVNSPKTTNAQTKELETTTTPRTTTKVTKPTTQSTTIETITETETLQSENEDTLQGNYMKELMENQRTFKKNKNDEVMLTSVRRTKPRWMPRFGIVPIPDQLAEKLMLRIRHMKVLHPERDTVRKIESIYPNDSNINL